MSCHATPAVLRRKAHVQVRSELLFLYILRKLHPKLPALPAQKTNSPTTPVVREGAPKDKHLILRSELKSKQHTISGLLKLVERLSQDETSAQETAEAGPAGPSKLQ